MEIKDIIKNKRLEKKLTLDDVGRLVGVSGATISRWESGDIANMKRDKIVNLANALGISPAIIMGWNENTSDITKTNNPEDIAKDDYERRLLMLCRDATKANPEDKEALVSNFESTIEIYKKAKGIK